jgi:hypothetical protein
MTDLVLIFYSTSALVGYAGFALFQWWQMKVAGSSTVYRFTKYLFLSIAFEKTLAGYARLIFLREDHEEIHILFESLLWEIRTVPTTVTMAIIVGLMYWRIINTIRDKKKEKENAI